MAAVIELNRSIWAIVVVVAACGCAMAMTDLEMLSSKPTKCEYHTAFEMYGAQCGGLHLSQIPSLKGSIEILDFSDNKLHELSSNTLGRYTNLKFLYLAENQIYEISEDALSSLTGLQSLDLSKNVILNLPSSILQLPNLEKLYLSGNPLHYMKLDDFVNTNTVIRAPLQLIDISDCKLRVLPEWGLLPQLVLYNISHNPLVTVEAKHFAMMCNLKKVDMAMSIDIIQPCLLKPAISWFQDNEVYFFLDDYAKLNSREFENCERGDIADAVNATNYKCKRQLLQEANVRVTRRTWLTISGGLLGFLVGFMLVLYAMHRHNVAQIKSKEQALKAKPDGDRNVTAVLLNNVS